MNLPTTETDEQLATARGQIGVLRDLLMEALSVISTIEPEDTDEFDSLSDLKEGMQAAIEGTKP